MKIKSVSVLLTLALLLGMTVAPATAKAATTNSGSVVLGGTTMTYQYSVGGIIENGASSNYTSPGWNAANVSYTNITPDSNVKGPLYTVVYTNVSGQAYYVTDQNNKPYYDQHAYSTQTRKTSDLFSQYAYNTSAGKLVASSSNNVEKINTANSLTLENAKLVTDTESHQTTDGIWVVRKTPGGLTEGTEYLAIYSMCTKDIYGATWQYNGKATFDFAGQGIHSFSFDWGSVSSTDRVFVTFDDGTQIYVTGATALAMLGTTTENTYSTVFTYSSSKVISSIAFQNISGTTATTFEISDLYVSKVPLPAALPLFGSALMGLCGFRKRKSETEA